MMEFMQIMIMPFFACLVLTGIHAYLGLHVIERQVIFVDLALAQIAVLGASFGILIGLEMGSIQSYSISLSFTLIGAGLFAATRFQKQKIPHEAIIGIVYVVSSALMLIVLSYSGEGTEHIRHSFVGNIFLVSPKEVLKILIIYSVVGVIHFTCRKPFFLISSSPDQAFKQGLNVKAWDFLFYALFGFVVTSSVEIAGVLLVFSFLVIPAVCAIILSDKMKTRLFLGWVIGTIGSMLGMVVSYLYDLPTGASVVCVFGLLLLMTAFYKKIVFK